MILTRGTTLLHKTIASFIFESSIKLICYNGHTRNRLLNFTFQLQGHVHSSSSIPLPPSGTLYQNLKNYSSSSTPIQTLYIQIRKFQQLFFLIGCLFACFLNSVWVSMCIFRYFFDKTISL